MNENIIENNKLIAEFMELKFHERSSMSQCSQSVKYVPHVSEINYHSSWDRLMVVVEKIESFKTESYWTDLFTTNTNWWGSNLSGLVEVIIQRKVGFDEQRNPYRIMCWWGSGRTHSGSQDNAFFCSETKLGATYEAIIEFIKWHNENIQP